MYIIFLEYSVSPQILERKVRLHKDFIAQQCVLGHFICCGSFVNSPGEVMISPLTRRQKLIDILRGDPFIKGKLAKFRLVPFDPINYSQNFSSFILPKDDEEITLVPHNEKWIKLFEEEARQLKKYFGKDLLDVHHIGSTAIKTIMAKPIIDIVPEITDIEIADKLTPILKKDGYESLGEFGLPQRRFFKKVKDGVKYHIHIWPQNHPEIKRHVTYCDYLKKNPMVAKEYEQLKKDLAQKYPNDIENYCWGKEAFIKKVEIQAGAVGPEGRFAEMKK